MYDFQGLDGVRVVVGGGATRLRATPLEVCAAQDWSKGPVQPARNTVTANQDSEWASVSLYIVVMYSSTNRGQTTDS